MKEYTKKLWKLRKKDMNNNSKFAYVSSLIDEQYLPGLFVLANTLKKTNTIYPLVVMIPINSSKEFEEKCRLYSLGGIIKRMEDIPIDNPITDPNLDHWKKSTFKLNAIRLKEFAKAVVLDCDLLIRKNIDDFFSWPHLSGGIPGQIFQPAWKDFNAGVIVIEPSDIFFKKCLSVVEIAKENGGFGGVTDQTILQATDPDWPNKKELHFPPYFHEYYRCVNALSKTLPNGINDIRIIHYWGKEKPWDYSKIGRTKLFIKNIFERRADINKVLKLYFKELDQLKNVVGK